MYAEFKLLPEQIEEKKREEQHKNNIRNNKRNLIINNIINNNFIEIKSDYLNMSSYFYNKKTKQMISLDNIQLTINENVEPSIYNHLILYNNL
jgi:hypothetical protein